MTKTQLDFTQSISLSGVVLLERVQKTVDIGYQFVLVTNNQWAIFPEMNLSLELEYPQFVKFSYNFNIGATYTSWLVVRLKVDNQ